MVFGVPLHAAESRVWRSLNGKFSVQAVLVGHDEQHARLQRDGDGRVISVPLSRLSEHDRAHLASAASEADPFAGRGEPAEAPSPTREKARFTLASANPDQPLASPADSAGRGWPEIVQAAPPRAAFRPAMLGGSVVIGDISSLLATREQRMDHQRARTQIEALLAYWAAPDAFAKVRKALEEKGATDLVRNELLTDFVLFEDCLKSFGGARAHQAYFQLFQQKTDPFAKGRLIRRLVGGLAQELDKLSVAEPVRLTFISHASFGEYNPSAGTLGFQSRDRVKRVKIGGSLNQIALRYTTPVDEPGRIACTPDEARRFRAAAPDGQVLLRTEVELSSFRTEASMGSSLRYARRTANARVTAVQLVQRNDPQGVLHEWPVGSPAAPLDESALAGIEDPVQAKMLRLAHELRIPVRRGYPVMRIDYSASGDASDHVFHSRLPKLFDRVAYGMKPSYLTPGYVARHFPEAIGKYVAVETDRHGAIYKSGWAGADEFDQHDNRDAFFRDYNQRLDNHKIALPIRFTEVYDIRLRANYDFDRGGYPIEPRHHFHFPRLLSRREAGVSSDFPRVEPTLTLQDLLPLDREGARALRARVEANGRRLENGLFVARTVTLSPADGSGGVAHGLPPVRADYSDFALYADPRLEHKVTDLQFQQSERED